MADILVVEDDDDVALLIEAFLEREGHHVRRATDGESGLSRLSEGLPDLVIMDVEMPLLSGPGMAARMLTEDLGRERIPLLVASGAVGLAAIVERVGTPYWIAKPFAPDALIALVSRALRERIHPTHRAHQRPGAPL